MKPYMKTNDNIATDGWSVLLNSVLAAINQHFLHARILKHQGQMEMADFQYKLSIESMRHADLLIEHMLAEGNISSLELMEYASIQTTPVAIVEVDKKHTECMKKAVDYLLQTPQSDKSIMLLNTICKRNSI